jgi:hypothetical protein
MNLFSHRIPGIPWQDLDDLESALQSTLKPVLPRREYILELKEKLLEQAFSTPPEAYSPRKMFLIAGAILFSSLLMIASGIRAAIAVVGAIGILHQVSRQIKDGSDSNPFQPAH